jgi:6-pyruvoyl-tetrahydropterin synthase related domain
MKAAKLFSTSYLMIVIIVVSMVITSHFMIYGIPNNDDSLIHFTFASAVYDSLSEGRLYVSGQPKANYGYGAFTVRFYPLLAAYSIASIYFVTRNWHIAGFLFFWLWMSIGGIGLFLFSKEWLDNKYAFLASILYIFEPYHNVQINSLCAYAEFVGGTVLVFGFLFTTRILKHGKTGDVIGLAASYSLLILSNIPITLIGSIALVVYALGCFYFLKSDIRKGIKVLTGFAIGVAGSSFYLYRLFSELHWINHADAKFLNVAGKTYDYYFVNNATAFFFGDLVLFNFLILMGVPIAVILFKARRDVKQKVYPLMIVSAFSLFMSTSYSGVIWRAFPQLQNVQFPWRWFTVASIGFGMIVALSASVLAQNLVGKKVVLASWVALFLISTLFFTYSYVVKANLIDKDFVIRDEDLQKTVETNSHRPTFDAWQTIWAQKSAFSIKEKVAAGDRDYKVNKWGDYNKQVKIGPGEAQNVRLAVSYYPHWKATVNGSPIEVSKTDDGAIAISIPPDESMIDLNFVEPIPIRLFLAVSCLTWLGLLAFCLVKCSGVFWLRTKMLQGS